MKLVKYQPLDDTFSNFLSNSFANFMLVTVHVSTVDMAIPNINSILYGLSNFTLRRL